RHRTQRLLLNTLPAAIVQQIASGNVTFVQRYPHASVLQADFEGFTALSARYPPNQVLSLLSDIFEAFDGLADKHGADKLKTIGDAYVVSAGALSPMPDHAAALVAMALEMVDAVTEIVMAAEAGL
ncbi:adenylate and guanylate cyclase catalytic domain-containing protein, partial [Emiliania huxleyi CCMP1516]|uniref:Guanylate cyclase domain-containing protein n=2 Tax=Emiliania huxleyi TaxID=2903 RepID=A0A0D3ITK7_EMIH1